jgi:membrane peptidoglycan carboxypeptidase
MTTPSSRRRRSDASALHLARALCTSVVVLAVCAALVVPSGQLLSHAFATSGDVAPRLRPIAERSTVYAADGAVIGRLGTRDRAVVRDIRQIPRVVVDAVVAAEDKSYWTNGGVDVPAMGRALVRNVESGGVEQGRSTIAQQLVKNRVLTGAETASRKAKELVLAYRLKHELEHIRLMLVYLNTVYFGENSYGIASAAERIAGKPLDQLTIADAALLAGLIHSPGPNDPFDHPDASAARRDEVLAAMVRQHTITRAQAADARRAPLAATTRPVPDLRPRRRDGVLGQLRVRAPHHRAGPEQGRRRRARPRNHESRPRGPVHHARFGGGLTARDGDGGVDARR